MDFNFRQAVEEVKQRREQESIVQSQKEQERQKERLNEDVDKFIERLKECLSERVINGLGFRYEYYDQSYSNLHVKALFEVDGVTFVLTYRHDYDNYRDRFFLYTCNRDYSEEFYSGMNDDVFLLSIQEGLNSSYEPADEDVETTPEDEHKQSVRWLGRLKAKDKNLRHYFIGQAIAGLAANPVLDNETLSVKAIELADAILDKLAED